MDDAALLKACDQMESSAVAREAQEKAGGGGGGAPLQGGMPSPEVLIANARALRQAVQAGQGDKVRAGNSKMAALSDAQILAAADQMESVASNPQMMAMAKQQIQNMTPEQMEEAKRVALAGGDGSLGAGGATPAAPAGGGGLSASSAAAPAMPTDPASLLAMDPKQLKLALASLKGNPAAARQAMASLPGSDRMSEAQLAAQLDRMAAMTEDELAQFLKYASSAQAVAMKARDAWETANSAVGGHLAKLLILAVLAVVAFLIKWLFFSSSSASAAGSASGGDDMPGFGPGVEYNAGSSMPTRSSEDGVGVKVDANGEVDDEFD